MSKKIIGYTVGTTIPKPSFAQTDPKKGDYIKDKEVLDTQFVKLDAQELTEEQKAQARINIGAEDEVYILQDGETDANAPDTAVIIIDPTESEFDGELSGGAYVEIANNLTTSDPSMVLSAAQGVVLKGLIDELDEKKESVENKSTELTAESTDEQYPSAKAVYDALSNITIEVDTTLTEEGKAADAKSVGEKITLLEELSADVAYINEEDNENITDVETGGVANITVDSALSTTSTNPVQNKVITEKVSQFETVISGLTTRLNALANSTDEDLDQMAEIVEYIKSNKDLIDGITTSKVSVTDIIDNLTTNVSNKPLSAKMGVELKALIDDITVPVKVSELQNDVGYITAIPSEYITETELNNKAYLPAANLSTAINDALSQAKESGEFDGESGVYVGSDENIPAGTKVHVNPEGEALEIPTMEDINRISAEIADLDKVMTVTSDELAAMSQEELAEMYEQGVRLLVVGEGENLVPTAISSSGVVLNGCGYLANYRLNSSGEIIVSDRAVMTGFIPFEYGKTVEITGGLNTAENGGQYIAAYDDAFNLLYVNYLASLIRDSGSEVCGIDNIRTYTVNTSAFAQSTNINGFKDAAYIRISINPGVGGKMRVRYI